MDIVDELFESDEANILTNRAAREIVLLRQQKEELEKFVEKAFLAHPNLDLDIEQLERK